ncbi:AAA family ATPase [Pallidibacillus pasinlerensis]|uniref:Nuclease SbcCD subunit C n=1 Tax=Pallidibacillus pasinlerensis TaxID=2703818 RepID=A0ABX0A1V6_9BACI|nr:SMC family ATPase [Pallidibacillus pasinlerensis]NCU16802.1 SMC family ATPase [Pallidibacillus pasinlerensis]
MRPIKLTMTAFGPYRDTEVIDFTELKENRLFVISGKTGAGKTTIFDAICFALYGSASGEDRSGDIRGLRSDFADDDVYTAVELEFELRGHYYRIKRQLGHKKKGNKTETGHAQEFYEKIDDEEVPVVDRQIVTEINKKVEELVGLTRAQFIQIVMLPQGEFRKLLTSETENKEEILRKIFKTERYTLISKRLKEKRDIAEKDFDAVKHDRDRYFTDIKTLIPEREDSSLFATLAQENFNTYQVLEGLNEEVDYYENTIKEQEVKEKQAELAFNQKLEEYHKAEALNAEFVKLEEKERSLQEEREKEQLFKTKELQLKNAEKASKIESYETQVNDWRKDEKEKGVRLELAEKAYNGAVTKLKIAEEAYKVQENKKSEREELSKQLHRFKELLPAVQRIEIKKKELAEQFDEVKGMAKSKETISQQLEQLKSSKQGLIDQIKETEQKVDQLPDKQQRVNDLGNQVRILQKYINIQQNLNKVKLDLDEKKQQYINLKERYDALETAWINGQAFILAAHLHDGEACPVCGSLEHPNKAQGQENIPTKEELDVVKEKLIQAERCYRKVEASYKSFEMQLEEQVKEVWEIGLEEEQVHEAYHKIVKEGKQVSLEVETLMKDREKLSQLKNERDQLEQNLTRLEAELESVTKDFQEKNTIFEKNKAVYEEQLKQIPEELRQLNILEAKIANVEKQLKAMEEAWEQVQKQLQSAKEQVASTKANLENAKLQLNESREKKEKAEQQFITMLRQAEFADEEAYRIAKMPESAQKQLKEEIDSYYRNLATLELQIKELQHALKDKQKVDLVELKTVVEQLQQQLKQVQDQLRQSQQVLQDLHHLKEKIIEVDKQVAELEKRKNIIADLYDVIRGQNEKKISFERYLQIEFLEQILMAANERLRRLSNGQYVLQRSDRQEARGRQSGLGLDVYDSYTGQTRDVKTLSGGEKFNASLSLALGMSDVIQSYQGAVQIDTMFIDEGFGSLDEESLTKAVDTLIDLQKSGRMIGIISHVQELKNAIPAILEVNKMKEGISKTQFIIK